MFSFVLVTGFFVTTAIYSKLNSLSIDAYTPTITPTAQVANHEELLAAQAEWELSAHADTFDNGMGANTTCARCKSPTNWDPSQELAAMEAMDCSACKRISGASRPELPSGIPVEQTEWQSIQCNICHIPVDGSYSTSIAFWDQKLRAYVPVENTNDLCAKCHEGKHGFEVVEEQHVSTAHQAWDCTRCHGSHGKPSACTDCHDPLISSGAFEHGRHPSVSCTACHDNGGLSIWQESDITSKFFGKYITRRFAHTLTSWPSHNLSKEVRCVRCHHPRDIDTPVLVEDIGCQACHPDGAVLFWCIYFQRDPEPDPSAP